MAERRSDSDTYSVVGCGLPRMDLVRGNALSLPQSMRAERASNNPGRGLSERGVKIR